jgi:excisionase family DNA binding protein
MQTATERIDDPKPRNRDERRAQARRDRLAYTVDELAGSTGTGRSKIYAEIRVGHLRAKKLGSRTLITAEAVDDWLKQLPDYQ